MTAPSNGMETGLAKHPLQGGSSPPHGLGIQKGWAKLKHMEGKKKKTHFNTSVLSKFHGIYKGKYEMLVYI